MTWIDGKIETYKITQHLTAQRPKEESNLLYFCQKTEKPNAKERKNRKPQRTTKPKNRHEKWPKPKIPTPPSRKHASLNKDNPKWKMKKAKQENFERGSGSTSWSTVLFFGYNNMPNKGIKNCKGYKEIKKKSKNLNLDMKNGLDKKSILLTSFQT